MAAAGAWGSASPVVRAQQPDFTGVWETYRGAPQARASGFGGPRAGLPLTEEGQRRVEEYRALAGPERLNAAAHCASYGVPAVGATPAANFNCSIAGTRVALTEEQLRALYRNRGDYVSSINHRLKELLDQGWMVPEYADDVRADAEAASIPNSGKGK